LASDTLARHQFRQRVGVAQTAIRFGLVIGSGVVQFNRSTQQVLLQPHLLWQVEGDQILKPHTLVALNQHPLMQCMTIQHTFEPSFPVRQTVRTVQKYV